MTTDIPVEHLLDEERFGLQLSLVAGKAGLSRRIESEKLAKAGVHLTGFFDHFRPDRIQVLGQAEIAYLESLPTQEMEDKAGAFFERKPVAVVITWGAEGPAALRELADRYGVALLRSELDTAIFSAHARSALDEELAPRSTLHGVLIDIFGVGILLLGDSGIGKSEVALDLILRGHRFVADDVVEVVRRRGDVIGRGSELIRHHIEIRGLGILNVKDLFGVSAVRERKKIELCLELIAWDKIESVERVGVDEQFREILDVKVPYVHLPVSPGRNIASIVEVAARNQLLRLQGIHSAKEFQDKLLENLSARANERKLGEIE
ncbi:MAG: HPr(Ser) kinase/phosphatase [Chrysiogenetes bacterium]|nr:HPr(Ser) kinase/phosphatase [Chrysiogenetes bacterium]